MSSHPGSTLNDAIELALCLKKDHYAPEQVQDYYPTPGTASTVMFYTGIDPLTMKPVYVPTDYHEKQLQRALLQFNRPQNAPLVREALRRVGREDLIGYGETCLVPPERAEKYGSRGENGKKQVGGRSGGRRPNGDRTGRGPRQADSGRRHGGSGPVRSGARGRDDARPAALRRSDKERGRR